MVKSRGSDTLLCHGTRLVQLVIRWWLALFPHGNGNAKVATSQANGLDCKQLLFPFLAVVPIVLMAGLLLASLVAKNLPLVVGYQLVEL